MSKRGNCTQRSVLHSLASTVAYRRQTPCSLFTRTIPKHVSCPQTRITSSNKKYSHRCRQPRRCVRRISESAARRAERAKSWYGPGTRSVSNNLVFRVILGASCWMLNAEYDTIPRDRSSKLPWRPWMQTSTTSRRA